jgi:hypothetical protein
MAAGGVPMRRLQEWMGHRDMSATERYADYAPSQHESALIEQAWGGRRCTTRGDDIAIDGDARSVSLGSRRVTRMPMSGTVITWP